MKGRLLVILVVLAMAAAACAEADSSGGAGDVTLGDSVAENVDSVGEKSDYESMNDPSPAPANTVQDDSADSIDSQDPQDTDGSTPSLVTSTTQPKATPTTGVTPPGEPIPPEVPAGPLAAIAKADLADRLNVDAAAVDVISVEEVTWRDGSLGCPQPGVSYTQALVNGSRIRLMANGIVFEYHAAAGVDPFYCSNPEEPVPESGT